LNLNLPNVKVINARSEALDYKFDFIISRAVASLSKLDSWTKKKFNNIDNAGLICLKGGDLKNELNGFENRVKIFDISNFFDEDFFSSKKIIFLQSGS
jgi:16S rRNA (guanine527-N7)-methyltransferase